METDADRLESIKALGGQLVSTERGSVWAIFDEDASQATFENLHINSTSPQLTLRAIDAANRELTKAGARVEVGDRQFTIRERVTGLPPGWYAALLDEE